MTTILAAIGASAATAFGSAGGASAAGPRELLHFGLPNLAAGDNASPALSTPVQTLFCGAPNIETGASAIRSGSVVGLSVNLSVAAGGSNAIFGVYKNGTIFNAATIVTLASATSDTEAHITFAAGTYPFVAGDVIDVRVRTGERWSAPTSDAAVLVEIETLS